MNLRPYQQEACGAAWDVICRARSPLVVMPTGTGKSVVLTHIAQRVVRSRKRVLVLAHRRELIEQLVRHLERTGLHVGIEMADFRSEQGWFGSPDVIVASKDSLRGRRLKKFDPSQFGLIITDEAHHAIARSYRSIYAHFQDVPHMGVTATPDRADKIGLGTVFDEVAFEYGIRDAIDDGWLVPLRQVRVSVQDMDFSNVKARGDLTDNQVAEIIKSEAVLHAMVGPMTREVGDSRCLMFLPRVDVAKAAVELTNRPAYAGHGQAEVVWGDMPGDARADVFDRFARGDIKYLANVGIACLDEKTEILTRDGWKGMDEVSYSDRVAQWDSGRIEFVNPLGIEIRDRKPGERMVVLETRNRSLRVTDDHRMVWRKGRTKAVVEARARDLVGQQGHLLIHGLAEPENIEPEQESHGQLARRLRSNRWHLRQSGLSVDEAREEAEQRLRARVSLRRKSPRDLTDSECQFIGFWLGDGTVQKLRSGGSEWLMWQAESYPNLCAWIDRVCEACGFDTRKRIKAPRRRGGTRVIQWSLPRGTGFGSQARSGVYAIEPYLNKAGSELLWGLSESQLWNVLYGFHIADGTHRDDDSCPRWMRISNTNKELLDKLQAIATCRGIRTSLSATYGNAKRGHSVLYRLSVSRAKSHQMTRYTPSFEPGWRSEKVWCVKVPSTFIVTRRNGYVTVTGNTEGWDDPATDGHGVQHLAMMRPTKSRALYAQAVGRILRPLPGTVDGIDTAEGRKAAIAMSNKPQAVVIDFVGNSGKHELVYAADILGGKAPAEVIRRVKEQPDSELTVDEQIAKAEDELLKEQQEIERIKRAHAKHREHIAADVKYRTVAVDPFTKVRFDDSNPVRPAAIGEGTWRVLRGANVPMSHIRAMTAEQAGAAAQWCMASRKRGGPTWKQAATLRRFGHNPDVMTFGEAKKELDVLAKNNWKAVSA